VCSLQEEKVGEYQSRKNIFVKITGDLADDRADVHEWIAERSQEGFVVVCIGGGTRISDMCRDENIPYEFCELGRQLPTFRARQKARDILEENQQMMQDMLAARGIQANVIIPVLDIASVLCHVNGDAMVQNAYLGFDDLYVLTLEGREDKKRQQFAKLPRVSVVSFPRLDSTSRNAF